MNKKTIQIILSIVLLTVPIIGLQFGGELPKTEPDSPTLYGNRVLDSDYHLKHGSISPGNSPGRITITGDFELGDNAKYECELMDLSGPGFGHDYIDVSGDLILNGTLDIVLDGYTPSDNHCFDIIEFDGSITGNFSVIQGLPAGWSIDYGVLTANTVTIYGPNCQETVGLTDRDKPNRSISFFPNPASDLIRFEDLVDNVTVIGSGGQTVLSRNLPVTSLDISGLAAGHYIVSINDGASHHELLITRK